MTLFDVVAWIVHGLAIWWAWPWLSDKSRVKRWQFWLSCCLPLISWCWLVPEGLAARNRRETERRREIRMAQRRESVRFLRQQLADGTPVEQENARQILAMWGVSEAESPAEQVKPWLVVGRPPLVYPKVSNCPNCQVEEIPTRNAVGQVCVTRIVGRTCMGHGGVLLNVEIPARWQR